MEEQKFTQLDKNDLLYELEKLQIELSNSHENLQLVKEDGLLDYYAYKIKAQEALHKFLIDKIKEIETYKN